MRSILEKALTAASNFPNNGGMASVWVFWHPYECGWQAKATWSDAKEVYGDVFDEPFYAVVDLLENLNDYC